MALTASCPTCNAQLQLTNHDSFDSWVCPAGHGLAATLSELYERAQDDEIHQLWALARVATPGADARHCPMCERPMASVTVPTDPTHAAVPAGESPTPGGSGEVPVDVCVSDEVVWFDAGELEALPPAQADAPPTAAQDAALADITRQFGEQIEAAEAAEGSGLVAHLASRLERSHRAFGLFSSSR